MKSLRGFTLIELLVVISVLGVLAVGLITIIDPVGQMKKTRDSIRQTDSKQITNALERYFVINGSYPITGGWVNSMAGSPWIPGLVSSGDLKQVPVDPVNTFPNPPTGPELIYYYNGNVPQDFCLQTSRETNPGSDPNGAGYWGSAWKMRYAPDGTIGGPSSICATQ